MNIGSNKTFSNNLSCFVTQENLVEQKHHKLARSLRSGPINRELKPNAATRDQLNVSHMLLGHVKNRLHVKKINDVFLVC